MDWDQVMVLIIILQHCMYEMWVKYCIYFKISLSRLKGEVTTLGLKWAMLGVIWPFLHTNLNRTFNCTCYLWDLTCSKYPPPYKPQCKWPHAPLPASHPRAPIPALAKGLCISSFLLTHCLIKIYLNQKEDCGRSSKYISLSSSPTDVGWLKCNLSE